MQQQKTNHPYFEIMPIQQDLKTLFLQTSKFKCIKNNKGLSVCSQNQCLKPGFICKQQDCQCQNLHYNCKTVLLKRIINTIMDKKKVIPNEIKQNYNKLYKKINNLIDELSNFRQKIELQQEYFGLNQNDLKFVDIVRQNKLEQVNGKIIYEIQKDKNQSSKKEKMFILFQQQIQEFIQNSKKQMLKIVYKIENNKENILTNEKYIALDTQNKKIFKEYSTENLKQNKNWQIYKFIPMTVNQNTNNFVNGAFRMSNQKIFEKVTKQNSWTQVTSNQNLPSSGKYYFQVNCHFTKSSYTLIGIVTQNCLQRDLSHCGCQESMCYFLGDGYLWAGRQGNKIGSPLTNNKGLVSVLINIDNKQIHWCIDGQYQGKDIIKQNLLSQNKKLFGEVQVYYISSKHQFIS